MADRKLRVLVFYGGEGGTIPRQELVTWMASKKSLNIEPRFVSWNTPHSAGSIADRVKEEIELADKAIAIVTKDPRSAFGAPNVIEEIGRWIQGKDPRTICVVRQEGTQVNSNVAGLPFVSFEERIREAFDGLRDFLEDQLEDEFLTAPPAKQRAPAALTIDSNPTWVLVDQRAFQRIRIDETTEDVTVVVACVDSAQESALRGLSRRSPVELVYANHVAQGSLSEGKVSHEHTQTLGTIVVSLHEQHLQDRRSVYQDMSFGGPNGMSADEIAEARARRLLTGEPRAKKNDNFGGPESLIRGMGQGIQVTESPIPRLLVGAARDERATWERLRIELVRLLLLTGCVERIDVLKLQVTNGKLVRVEFRGARRVSSGLDPVTIEVNESVDF